MKSSQPLLVVAALLNCGACALGLDPTDKSPDGKPADPLRVTFETEAIYFGGTFSSRPFVHTEASLKAWAVDLAAPEGFRQLPITFNGPIASCELPLGNDGLWQVNMPPPFNTAPSWFPIGDATRVWRATIGVAGGTRVAVSPPANATLNANVTLSEPWVAGDGLVLMVLGAWIQHNYNVTIPPGASTFAPPALAMNEFGSVIGKGVPAITSEDRVFLHRYRGPQLIGSLQVPPFEMMAGANPITGVQTSTPATRTISATADTANAASRVARFMTPNSEMFNYWQVNAVTDSKFNFTVGPQLNSGSLSPENGIISANITRALEPDLKALMNWIVAVRRYEVDADNQRWPLHSGLNTHDRDPVDGHRYLGDTGLPTGLSLNGVPLTSERQVLAIPRAQPIEFAITADQAVGDLRHIDCYRFDLNPQRYTFVAHIRVLGDRVRVPATTLPPGARYMCRPHIYKGVPNANQGDDHTRETVMSVGYHDSSSFIVQ